MAGQLLARLDTTLASAVDNGSNIRSLVQPGLSVQAADSGPSTVATAYRARIRLEGQHLRGPDGVRLPLAAGMQVAADIHQGRRTVLEYLLSPVKKSLSEAARER